MNKLVLSLFFLSFTIMRAEPGAVPTVREVSGGVVRYDEPEGSFVPAEVGYRIIEPTLFLVEKGGELIASFPGKIAARLAENSQAVLAPVQNGRYEVDLRKGTVSALLDPKRYQAKEPAFLIRTLTGVTEATGTFYAVTEYKGQSYSAVKKGKVKKKVVPPPKPDFSAYLKKATTSAKSRPKFILKK